MLTYGEDQSQSLHYTVIYKGVSESRIWIVKRNQNAKTLPHLLFNRMQCKAKFAIDQYSVVELRFILTNIYVACCRRGVSDVLYVDEDEGVLIKRFLQHS